MSLKALAAAAAFAVASAACVPPESRPIAEFERAPAIRELRRRGALRAGIPLGSYPWGPRGRSGAAGFTSEIAGWIGEELGVPVVPVYAPADELVDLIDQERLDVAFPGIPITEKRLRRRVFSHTYFVSHQRLLVTEGSPLASLRDVGGDERVCAVLDETTAVAPAELVPEAEVVDRDAIPKCITLLENGRVEVVTASEYLLVQALARYDGIKLVGEDLNTEGHGALVPLEASATASFVTEVMLDAIEDGRWEEAYERWVAPHLEEPFEPPDLTAEEAAAFFPASLAP